METVQAVECKRCKKLHKASEHNKEYVIFNGEIKYPDGSLPFCESDVVYCKKCLIELLQEYLLDVVWR